MLQLLTMLALGSFLVLASFAAGPAAADGPGAPTVQQIEDLLRQSFPKDADTRSRFSDFNQKAALLEFELLELERISASRWHVEVDLLLDFGDPPRAVLGFQRLRRGRYDLLLDQQGDDLDLKRLTSKGAVQLLPIAH